MCMILFSLVVMQNGEWKYFCSDFFPMALKWIDAAFTKALCYQNMPRSEIPTIMLKLQQQCQKVSHYWIRNTILVQEKNYPIILGVRREGEGCQNKSQSLVFCHPGRWGQHSRIPCCVLSYLSLQYKYKISWVGQSTRVSKDQKRSCKFWAK